MPTYLLTHHFPADFQPSPEGAAAVRAWFERLGASHIGGGNPDFEPQRIGTLDGAPKLIAHTLVSTEDMATAIALAQQWPVLRRGGGIQLTELRLTGA